MNFESLMKKTSLCVSDCPCVCPSVFLKQTNNPILRLMCFTIFINQMPLLLLLAM